MSIYRHITYRPAIEEIVENQRKLPGRKFTLRKLAEATGLQASYLTNVLKGRFDFSADQLFAVATELGLSAVDREYLLLLLEFERSVHKPRKAELKKEIDKRRAENLRTEKHLSVKNVEISNDAQAQFYLDPFAQLVFKYLSLAPYNKSPELLAPLLGISKLHLGDLLKVLLGNGFVKLEGDVYKIVARNIHLPRQNPLSGPHLTLMRVKSLDQLQRLTMHEAYSNAVTFTGNKETKDQLTEAYLNFLKKAESIVRPAPSEEVFQMNFDLFPWKV